MAEGIPPINATIPGTNQTYPPGTVHTISLLSIFSHTLVKNKGASWRTCSWRHADCVLRGDHGSDGTRPDVQRQSVLCCKPKEKFPKFIFLIVLCFSSLLAFLAINSKRSLIECPRSTRIQTDSKLRLPDTVRKIVFFWFRSQFSFQVVFRNVRFTYPSRPTEEVIAGISLDVPAGTVVGVVGHSGSGKSTIISLIERFYEVESGSILIDGVPLKDYCLEYVRQHIGLGKPKLVFFLVF